METLSAGPQSTWVCSDAYGNPYFFCTNHWLYFSALKAEIRRCRRTGGEVQLLQGDEAEAAMHRAQTFWPRDNPKEQVDGGTYFRVSPDYPHDGVTQLQPEVAA